MTTATYNLYVDESGSFTGPHQPSVVCGVLEDTSAKVDWAGIRDDAASALPLMDYPFHAALLNSPSAWLAAVLRRPSAAHEFPARERDVRRSCGSAVRALAEVPSGREPAIDAFKQAISADRVPDFATLGGVDAWLRRAYHSAYRELAALTEATRQRLRDAFRHSFRRHRHGDLIGVAAVALPKDLEPADGYSDASATALRLDAYVRALETLFERVFCVLRGPEACRVDLWVATRHVQTRGFGTLDLGRDGILQLARRVQEFPRPSIGDVRAPKQAVTLTTARGIVRFDAAAPMGLVVADFLSNRLHHKLRGRAQASLESVSQQIGADLCLPLSCAPADPSATSALPTLCADGSARSRIRDAFVRGVASGDGLAPRWNREQACRWIDFAANAARGARG